MNKEVSKRGSTVTCTHQEGVRVLKARHIYIVGVIGQEGGVEGGFMGRRI